MRAHAITITLISAMCVGNATAQIAGIDLDPSLRSERVASTSAGVDAIAYGGDRLHMLHTALGRVDAMQLDDGRYGRSINVLTGLDHPTGLDASGGRLLAVDDRGVHDATGEILSLRNSGATGSRFVISREDGVIVGLTRTRDRAQDRVGLIAHQSETAQAEAIERLDGPLTALTGIGSFGLAWGTGQTAHVGSPVDLGAPVKGLHVPGIPIAGWEDCVFAGLGKPTRRTLSGTADALVCIHAPFGQASGDVTPVMTVRITTLFHTPITAIGSDPHGLLVVFGNGREIYRLSAKPAPSRSAPRPVTAHPAVKTAKSEETGKDGLLRGSMISRSTQRGVTIADPKTGSLSRLAYASKLKHEHDMAATDATQLEQVRKALGGAELSAANLAALGQPQDD